MRKIIIVGGSAVILMGLLKAIPNLETGDIIVDRGVHYEDHTLAIMRKSDNFVEILDNSILIIDTATKHYGTAYSRPPCETPHYESSITAWCWAEYGAGLPIRDV